MAFCRDSLVERRMAAFRLPLFGLSLLLVLFAGCDFGGHPSSPARSVRDIDPMYPVGAFALTERSGRRIRDSDLRGKVWIASFVFTRCTGPCPQVTATMARLQSELKGTEELRLVTFSVDPERDDPAELTRYANHFRADPERWLFLTGKEEEIHHLIEEGFKLAVARKGQARAPVYEFKTKESHGDFDHSTRLAVVDRQGRIRGYYDGIRDELMGPDADALFTKELQRLKDKVAALVHEPGSPSGIN
jgi:protein SCO1